MIRQNEKQLCNSNLKKKNKNNKKYDIVTNGFLQSRFKKMKL